MPNPQFSIPNPRNGFTLLEVVIVIAVMVVLASVSWGFFGGLRHGAEVELMGKRIAADLALVRTRAIAGEDSRNWGILFRNLASDRYELFSSPTDYTDPAKTVYDTIFLPDGVIFTDPSEVLQNKPILFARSTGTLATQTSVAIQGTAGASTISVSALGAITVQ